MADIPDWTVDLRARVKAAVAGQANGVYYTVRPQGREPPDVVMRVISDPNASTFAGDQGLREARVQFDCWAADRALARQMALAIIPAISGPATQGGTRFDRAFCDDPEDGGELIETGYIHRARFDAMVWHAPA